ncbi:helix-turn-helix domain-containing protein, partial [Patescibacteria group bacterium]|nr:helix-turn-helix domain-containing protein [Patescibacteria group bacterium]
MGKLSVEQRAEIARRAESESKTKLAEEFGVSRQTIYRTADEFEANKVSLQNAFGEFGVTGLSRFGGSVMEDYDTEWQSLSRMVKLVKEMLDWPIVGSMAFAIEMSLRKAEWTATPASEEKADVEAAEFLESCINDMSQTWDDHITQAVSMLWFGFAPFEMVFKRRLGMDKEPDSKYDDGRIGWRKFAFRAQDS